MMQYKMAKGVMDNPKFSQSIQFYRKTIRNPYVLSKKVYSLMLDPANEYKKVKQLQKAK